MDTALISSVIRTIQPRPYRDQSLARYVGTVDCVFVVKAVIQIIPAAAGQGRHLYCSACVVTPERPEMTAHKLPVAWQSNLEVKSTRA